MKKPIVIILILIFVLGLLVILTLLFTRTNNSAPNQTPTPTIITQSDNTSITDSPISETPYPTPDEETKEIFDDHHLEQFPTNAPLKNAELIPLENTIPSEWQLASPDTYQANEQGRKFSPNKQSYVVVSNRTTQIFETNGDNNIRTIPFADDVAQVNAVWVNDQFVLLSEKDTSERQLDRMYLVNKDTGEKTFTLGSFPVLSRFNLTVDPKVYNNGTDVVFTDNDGQLWNLHLSY